MNEMKTILICDDKQNILEVLNDFFDAKDFTVILSRSGEQALELVRTELPDIILTDFKLPGISGIDLLEQIQQIDRNLPVIVITAFGMLLVSGVNFKHLGIIIGSALVAIIPLALYKPYILPKLA